MWYVIAFSAKEQFILEVFEDYAPAYEHHMYYQLRAWTQVNDYTKPQDIILTQMPPIAAKRLDNMRFLFFSDILALVPTYLPQEAKEQFHKDCTNLVLYLKQTGRSTT
jgi:hypothetical protein